MGPTFKYPNDFPLYDHYIHALEYLGYNFAKLDGEQNAPAKFVGEDDEWEVKIEVTLVRKPSR